MCLKLNLRPCGTHRLIITLFFIFQANYIDYFNKREEMKTEMAAYWKESLSKKFAGSKPSDAPWPIISPQVASLK